MGAYAHEVPERDPNPPALRSGVVFCGDCDEPVDGGGCACTREPDACDWADEADARHEWDRSL